MEFSKINFPELASFRARPAVSVFIPTHSSGVEVNELQDAILFKSILQDTRKKLDEQDYESAATAKILQPGFDLVEDDDFWRNQQQGLAVFMGADFFRTVKMPVPVSKEVFTGTRFHVLPLFNLKDTKPFFLLVFSKGDAKFYRGNRFGLEEFHVKGLPNGIDDVIHFEEKGGQQTFRRAGNKGKAAFHGHGA
ncbi:MAG TPA: hypothetical protein VD772_04390, partial [Anseongella sp.]|nr:hypothetical protein [Anseongella sp.]